MSTRSTLVYVSIPTCTGSACDKGETILYVVNACMTLIDWVGPSLGSWGDRPSLKSRMSQGCLVSEAPRGMYKGPQVRD